MTSKFTREELLNIIETDHVQCGEASALACMALAAMDSEPVEMPLDYLQGHKDGLEWASQLAEANHPETGDWLYDDPIELAKAIRKGPDMQPAQPVEDSEPDRNPVLAYADSYRDMAKQGVESVPIWSVITDLERNIAPLYRHAQPASEYPEVLPCPVLLEPGLRFGKGIKTSTMLAALARRAVYESDMAALSPEERAEFQAGIEDFKALIAQPAPVVSVVPVKIPGSVYQVIYQECGGFVDCDANAQTIWDACRAAMLAAAPHDTPALNSLQSVDSVTGGWIPVSERVPEVGVKVLCFPAEDEPIHAVFNGQLWLQDVSWSASYEPIDNVIPITVTHWMPLPAAPQEVNRE